MSKQHNKHESKDDSTESEKIEFNFSTDKLWKFGKIILPIFLLIVCMYFAAHYRLQASDLSITDDWAQQNVYNNVKYQIAGEVNKQNPFLPDQQKTSLIEQKTADYIKANQAEYDNAVTQLSANIKKQFQDDNGDNYLVGIDPYFFLRYVKNVLDHGSAGEYDKDGKSYTKFMLAPTETDVTEWKDAFHVYFSVFLYKFVHFFNDKVSLIYLYAIVPAIFAVLAMIPAFFIGRKLAGNLAGFITATYIGLHVSILGRTTAGFSDTDMYNIFFPLVVMFFVIYAIESDDWKKSSVYALLAAFTLLVYHTAWPAGWWYMFYFPLVAYGVIFLVKAGKVFMHNNKHKIKFEFNKLWTEVSTIVISGAVFVVGTITIMAIDSGNLISTLKELLAFMSFSSIKNAAHANLWPNVYTTVAEMNEGTLNAIISSLGNITANGAVSYSLGIIFLIISVIAVWLLIIKDKKNISNIGVGVMLLAWATISIWASLKGIRFIMFIIPPLGILIGIFFDLLIQKIAKGAENFMQVSEKWTKAILSIIVALMILVPMMGLASGVAKQEIPSLDDAWAGTLLKIKNESQPTAIISSWWDFGHQFITIAERGATADGANQNTPQAHWLGKLLITNNPRETAGILRMLDCDSNNAFEKLQNYNGNDTLKTMKQLDQLTIIGKSEAEKYLANEKLSDAAIVDVLKSTHCDAPEAFLITSEDMACMARGNGGCSGKTGVWAHFGLWNFTKAEIWTIVTTNDKATATKLLVDKGLVKDQKEADNSYNLLSSYDQNQGNSWIADWPNYVTPMAPCNKNGNTTFVCQNGALIDLENETATLQTNKGTITAKSLIYIKNGSVEIVQGSKDGQFSVAFNGKEAIVASPSVAESVFTQLFYLETPGDTFTKFDDVTSVLGERVITWKVNWTQVMKED